MIKYAVYPGYVISKNDGDEHYIGARQLMRLYGVSQRECRIFDKHHHHLNSAADGLIALYPRFDGNYTLQQEL
jgi:hypothetical protein